MAKKYDTAEQDAAFGSGVGYAHGKANKLVKVKPENQAAFRDGVECGRKMLGVSAKPKAKAEKPKSREDKIRYYSGRIDDPSLTARQQSWAVKRLHELAAEGK